MASTLGSVAPSHLLEAVTDHIPDHLPLLHDRRPELPDLAINVGDVTGRLRSVSDAAGSVVGNLSDAAGSVVGNLSDAAGSVVGEVGARVGRSSGSSSRPLTRFALPALLIAVVSVGLLAYLRSRRSSSTSAPAGAPSDTLTPAS